MVIAVIGRTHENHSVKFFVEQKYSLEVDTCEFLSAFGVDKCVYNTLLTCSIICYLVK